MDKRFVAEGELLKDRICLICGKAVGESSVFEIRIENNTYALAHDICRKAMIALTRGVALTIPVDRNALSGFIEEIEGRPLLMRRDFASKFPYVLGYFAFYKGTPRYAHELNEWIKASGIKLANPSDYIRKLTMASKLARLPDEDGKLRYLITELGHKEILQLLEKEI